MKRILLGAMIMVQGMLWAQNSTQQLDSTGIKTNYSYREAKLVEKCRYHHEYAF
ncbi:hypothetical protein [Elizabethkingia sp. JS20170427COW]|uniref:hypothetical protein n=1 Tax=Elizabethkingia sp. JS20170427COW TaxID=2583851 RepID=UPI002102EF53|nr:hypothetical protein [Elizabethkingia sp. JS20170427COW]